MHTHDTTPRRQRDQGTTVTCACGADLLTLDASEGVYPRGTLLRTLGDETTTKEGACRACGAAYSIPVTRWRQ
jgi:hypothetical protein